jgi:site-specific DNA-methyltransferase (adenine-specific)
MGTGKQPEVLIYNEGALEFLRELPDGAAQLIVMDPPYPSINRWRARGSKSCRRLIDWFPAVTYEYLSLCLVEIYRVLGPDSHCYVFGDWETMHAHVYPDAEQAGFHAWSPLVWDKKMIGMGYHYRPRTELIAFLEKGKRRLHSMSIPNLLSFPRVRSPHAYPTEKPVELLEVLVAQSSEPSGVVVDPFCGSGATGVASHRLGRRFLGADIEERACEHARQAISAGQAPYVWAREHDVVFRERLDRKALRLKLDVDPGEHDLPEGLGGEPGADAPCEAR